MRLGTEQRWVPTAAAPSSGPGGGGRGRDRLDRSRVRFRSKGGKKWPPRKRRWEREPPQMRGTRGSRHPSEGPWGSRAALGMRLLDRGRLCEGEGVAGRQGGRSGSSSPPRGGRSDRTHRGPRAPGRGCRPGVNEQRPGACSARGNEPGLSRPWTLRARPGQAPRAGLGLKNSWPAAPRVGLSSARRRRERSGPCEGETGVPPTLESLGPHFSTVQNFGR